MQEAQCSILCGPGQRDGPVALIWASVGHAGSTAQWHMHSWAEGQVGGIRPGVHAVHKKHGIVAYMILTKGWAGVISPVICEVLSCFEILYHFNGFFLSGFILFKLFGPILLSEA